MSETELQREIMKAVAPYARVYAKSSVKKRAARLNGDGFTAAEWTEMKQCFKSTCAYCGIATALTIDHIVPLIDGGKHEASNIVPACLSCNSSKNRRPLAVFLAVLVARSQ